MEEGKEGEACEVENGRWEMEMEMQARGEGRGMVTVLRVRSYEVDMRM